MENGALSHYRDGIQNLERESSHVEVPGAANNADRAPCTTLASKFQTHFWVTCSKEKFEKLLCRSTASYLKLVNGKCVDKGTISSLQGRGVSAHTREFVSGPL